MVDVNSLMSVLAPLVVSGDVCSRMGSLVTRTLMGGVAVAVCKQKETSPPIEYTYVTLTNVNSLISGF
jgi:hypothetical protein